ncbi:hypothetical protein DXI23_04595 [Marinobacter flavimaris]|uniref:Uncharacterized protein n=1 Tax=Marinobacter flavimaris TaxID=262076 RepID=A0A3D8H8A0_9GAMM|nr:hypothetical protein [Marinobacter flavimaris]PPI79531.1 hypothetical protein MDHKLMBL_15380 [Marinobacter flavimaris]RDU42943.1 hypothetical protein DXI23_04595 [Marinobacter flavimaris]
MIQNTNYHGPTAFFRKHWNGDYSLARSYWINTLLVSLFAPALGLLISPLLQDLPARYSSASVLALTALGLLIWVWAITGTWASANKHVERGGKQGWATAAKLVIILSIIRTIGDVGNLSASLEDHWRVAMGEQAGPEYTVQVSADGQSIVFRGGMNDGAAEALSNALDMAPAVKNVVFNSMGGWVREGNLVADIILERKLSTYVEGECTSACTIAFLAGKDRLLGPNAKIGFHQFKFVGETFGENSDQTAARDVYERSGVSREFINRIVAIPSEEVWYPEKKELMAANVITQESNQKEITSPVAGLGRIDAGNQDIEKGLIDGFKQAADEINQSTPTMVDSETRLDKATVGPGAVLTYHYTFPNYSSDELDSVWIKSELRQSVTSNVCKNEIMKPALEYGGKYVYSYSGSDQIVIESFQITQKDCGDRPRASVSKNFVPVKLPHGVQIELPKNWQVLSENQRITIDSSVQSRAEFAGEVFDASSDLNFGANYYDDAGKTAALMNVRFYPNLEISQADARASGIPDISELDSVIRDSMTEAGQINGFSVLEWSGTSKQKINGITAFVTEYKRSSIYNSSNFKVRLVRVFNKERSFTMTVSYRENQEHLLRPICDRIVSSINI